MLWLRFFDSDLLSLLHHHDNVKCPTPLFEVVVDGC